VQLPPYDRYDAATYDGTRALIWPPSATQPKALHNKPSRSVVLTVGRSTRTPPTATAPTPRSRSAITPTTQRCYATSSSAQPRQVLLNHGRRDFVWRLRRLGIDATYLEANEQLALF